MNIENLMLKREHFPVELLDWSGKPFINDKIIPPFHKSIIENGIDLELAYSVIDEAVENSLLDIKEIKIRTDVLDMIRFVSLDKSKIVSEKLDYGILQKDDNHFYYPTFPLTNGLLVQKNKISPYGGDGHITISKDSVVDFYFLSKSVVLPKELLEEYGMEVKPRGDFNWIYCITGWRSHNVDSRDVFYKNFVIALDNAVVRKKYPNNP